MVTGDGTTKLLDFGLAKLANDLSEPDGYQALTPALGIFSQAAKLPGGEPTADGAHPKQQIADSVPQESGSGSHFEDPRLAKDERPPVTAAGAIIGTPTYMPPEMWSGAPATERSDIYMLAAVLYELCCGQTLHRQNQRAELRRAVLEFEPEPLLVHAPEMHPRLAEIIDSCVRRDPQKRIATAMELVKALEQIKVPSAPETGSSKQLHRSLRRYFLLFLLAVLAFLGGLEVWRRGVPVAPQELSPSKPRLRLAVLHLKIHGEDLEHLERLSLAFTGLLEAELSADEQLRVLPADRVERMKLELHLTDAEEHSLITLERIRKNLSPDLIVLGSLQVQPVSTSTGRIQIVVRLQNTLTGMVVATSSVSGRVEELFAMVSQVGRELRMLLGIKALSSDAHDGLRAIQSISPEIMQLYAEGQLRLRRFDPAGARRLLIRVVAAEPDYSLGHLALAESLHALGYDERAREEVRRAFELSRHLRRQERYLIEARYRETTAEWNRAISLYRALAASASDDPQFPLYLSDALLRSGQAAEAQRTLQVLRRSSSPIALDPRIDIAEAKALMEMSDYTGALLLLERAAHHQEAAGAPLLLASTHLLVALVHINLGNPALALRSAESARDIFASAGDTLDAVESLLAIGRIHSARGDYERALKVSEETLQDLVELEHDTLAAVHLGHLAALLCQRGQLDMATARAEAGLLLGRQVNSQTAMIQARVTLGFVALLRADLPAAERHYQHARDLARTTDDPRMMAWLDDQMGQLRYVQGRLFEAETLHRQALALRLEHHLDGVAAESRIALAQTLLRLNKPAEAESEARLAVQRFQIEHNADQTAWAQTLLAQALLANQHMPQAHSALEAALARLPQSQNVLLQLRVLAVVANFPQKSPSAQESLRDELHRGLARAESSGLRLLAMKLRLQEYRLTNSREAKSNSKLCELSQQAHELGWMLLAQDAKSAAATDCARPAGQAAQVLVSDK